eukprot:3316338-Prymnesium_polylepis.1
MAQAHRDAELDCPTRAKPSREPTRGVRQVGEAAAGVVARLGERPQPPIDVAHSAEKGDVVKHRVHHRAVGRT